MVSAPRLFSNLASPTRLLPTMKTIPVVPVSAESMTVESEAYLAFEIADHLGDCCSCRPVGCSRAAAGAFLRPAPGRAFPHLGVVEMINTIDPWRIAQVFARQAP